MYIGNNRNSHTHGCGNGVRLTYSRNNAVYFTCTSRLNLLMFCTRAPVSGSTKQIKWFGSLSNAEIQPANQPTKPIKLGTESCASAERRPLLVKPFPAYETHSWNLKRNYNTVTRGILTLTGLLSWLMALACSDY
jgi:hypothetical protein